MQVIFPVCKGVQRLLGDQPIRCGKYKSSVYNYFLQFENDWYVYNSCSRAFAQLTEEEYNMLRQGISIDGLPVNNEQIETLISSRYLMQEETDETDSYIQIAGLISDMTYCEDITSYTILTTTACNARCFYCFESDFKPVSMSEQTARDLAEYIAEHCGKKTVRLHWFGGEPLCNIKAIETIVGILKEKKIPYVSDIITNGYAFDEDIIKRARNQWQLKRAQITLDGMAEEHNRRKNFQVKDANPFDEIIKNIHLLAENGISVSIRLNFDQNNIESIQNLIQYLIANFKGKKNIHAYPSMLFDACGAWNANRTESESKSLQDYLQEFNITLANAGLLSYGRLSRGFKIYHCGSNDPRHRTVNPDGRFSVCHNYSDTCVYGDIYHGITDRVLFDKWMKNVKVREKCVGCKWLPECTSFDQCPTVHSDCDKDVQRKTKFLLEKEIEKWKESEVKRPEKGRYSFDSFDWT